MDNGFYCTNCGEKNKSGTIFCIKCGSYIIPTDSSADKEKHKEEEKKALTIGITSILLYFFVPLIIMSIRRLLPSFLSTYVSSLNGLCILIAIVLMIVGRVKYPDNDLLKVIMWAYIIILLLFVVFFIFIYITCGYIESFSLSGCY